MKTFQEHIVDLEQTADNAAHFNGPVPVVNPWELQFSPAPDETVRTEGHGSIEIPMEPVAESSVFGETSRLSEQVVNILEPQWQSDRQQLNYLLLDGLSVLFLLFFLTVLYRFRSSIAQLFRSFFLPGQFDTLIDEQSVTFRTFTRITTLSGSLALTVIGFKWAIGWSESAVPVAVPEPLIPFLLPLLAGALTAIWLYKRIVSGFIVVLTRKKEQVDKITTFNRLYMSMSSFLLAPAALLGALVDPVEYLWLMDVQVIVLIILVLYYIVKSFSFFVSRKISILHWILYLCAVEIWPVSFFALFALRGFDW